VEQLFNQIHVRQNHSPAAVPAQSQQIQSLTTGVKRTDETTTDKQHPQRSSPFRVIRLQQIQIRIPFISDHFATGKASNWNNHDERVRAGEKV
jgi:hypothetical protein